MATLVNKMNREVKVILPNMREFRVFYSDNEGSVMFFKRDWREEKQEEHWKPSDEENLKRCIEAIPTRWTAEDGTPLRDWLRSITSCFNSTGIVEVKLTTWKPSEEQMEAILRAEGVLRLHGQDDVAKRLAELYEQLKKLI